MKARSSDIAAGVIGFGVLVMVIMRIRVMIRMRMSKQVMIMLRIAYIPVFGIPRADVGGADFLM